MRNVGLVNEVNGVNIAASPSYPSDGLCPTCRDPFFTVEVSTPVLVETKAGRFERVEAPEIEGPYFVPCRHDARCCFPPVDKGRERTET